MRQLVFIFVIFALVGGFSAIVYFGSLDRKSKTGNGLYDERQLTAQGKAYKWGFITMMVVSFAIFIVETWRGRELMAAGEAPIITVCCGATVMSVYCIVKDAYVSIKGSKIATLVSMGYLGVWQLFYGITRLRDDGAVVDGRLGYCWIYFAYALLALSIFISLLVKTLLDRRNRE